MLWADDNTTGGIDRGYAIDDVTFTGKQPPTVAPISDIIADVLGPVYLRVQGSNSAVGPLQYSLASGAPASARINPTNGIFIWTPARADAGTTNAITIRVADALEPASFTEETFAIVVRPYAELIVNSTVVEHGESSNLIVQLTASAPLSGAGFNLAFAAEKLAMDAIENLVPTLANGLISTSSPGALISGLATLPGQVLNGSLEINRIHFTATAEQHSAFVPLTVTHFGVTRSEAGLEPTLLFTSGRVIVVNNEALLEASKSGESRTLTLFGLPGTNYAILVRTNVAVPPAQWQSVTPSNLVTLLDAQDHMNQPHVFYSAVIGAPAPSSAPSMSPAKSLSAKALKAAAKLQKRKAAMVAKKLKKKSRQILSPALLPR